MGKHKPIFDPSTDCGDYVVAVGCHDLHTTGKKRFQKKYYTHTTRPGSLKELTMDKLMAKWGGAEILRWAVRGLLPKNRLRDKRMARLKAFEGLAHPYKENIIRYREDASSILSNPEVQKTLQDSRTAAAKKAPKAAAPAV
jgi:large subunit ribosomal protein L13